MAQRKRLHFKDIDGIRFFMLLPALLYCSMLSIQPQGEGITVEIARASSFLAINSFDFFFFISAFLIVSHALREIKYKQNFSLRFFYIRRILRIFPLLIIAFLFIFFFHPWIIKTLKLFVFETPSLKPYLMGIPNFLTEFNGAQNAILAVTFALFMFLQFYFVIGLILRLIQEHIVWIGLILIFAGIVVRYVLYGQDSDILFNTLAYLTPIGFGILLAYIIREEFPIIEKIKTIHKGVISAIYIIGVVHFLFAYLIAPNYIGPFVPVISSIILSLIVIEQTYGKNSLFKLRKNKLISRLGKISLGLFVYYGMFSIITVIAVESLDLDLVSNPIKAVILLVTFVSSWLMADLSYNYIEQPFRNFKRDFKRE